MEVVLNLIATTAGAALIILSLLAFVVAALAPFLTRNHK